MAGADSAERQYDCGSQERLIRLILVLFGDVVHGFAPGVLARELGVSPATITRDMSVMKKAGLAEKDEDTGAWRLSARLPQQAIKVWTAFDRAERNLQERKNKFSRRPD